MTAEADVERLKLCLKRLIRGSPFAQKELDARIGVTPGYLSQVFVGRLDLKLKHLFRILEVLGADPATFFDTAYSREPAAPAVGVDLLGAPPASSRAAGKGRGRPRKRGPKG